MGGGPQAGWLDDPDDPGRVRWWDGQRWTEHRRAREPGDGTAPPPVAPPTLAGISDQIGARSTVGDLNAAAVGSVAAGVLWAGGFGSIVAIVLGVVARRQLTQATSPQRGGGLATAGIVLGVAGLVVPLVLFASLWGRVASDPFGDLMEDATHDDVRMVLLELRDAQEAFHHEHGRYADDDLELLEGHPGVVTFVARADEDDYCIEALPARGGRPLRITADDPEPTNAGC